MSVRSAGWNMICDACGQMYGDTRETEAEATADDTGCWDCNQNGLTS